jgi:subtilisin family serine protease
MSTRPFTRLFIVRAVLLVVALAVVLPSAVVAATVRPGSGMSAAGVTYQIPDSPSGRYAVLLKDAPLAAYDGGVANLRPTDASVTGARKLDVNAASSRLYLDYLSGAQTTAKQAMKATLGHNPNIVWTYRVALNGFAIEMSRAEAESVAALPQVQRVIADSELHFVTDVGPTWIGAPGIWTGDDTNGAGASKGEGVVAGVIDSGVNHDHPSFAATGGDGYTHTNPRGTFYGACDPVLGLPFCNNKLIGVWDFTGTTPEDDNGHGSHTASTVAGNVLDAALEAPTITVNRHISGVAPHANLITYKACYTTPAIGTCLATNTSAAIDQAVTDAVDVINFSIGGTADDPWSDLNATAFLNAQRAGVFVSVAAGNDGPSASTIGSPANAPWVTSVAASTHNRKFTNALINMAGGSNPPPDLLGASVTSGYGPATIVYAGDYGYPLCGDGPANETSGEAAINPFTPGTFNGEIVVCDRGTYGRVEKGQNVMEGGAGGYVLANDLPSGDSLVGDAYTLPGVNIGYDDGVTLKTWLATAGTHTGTIRGTLADEAASNGDVTASFSSRGPNPIVSTVIKPDVTAPGVDVLAAFKTDPTDIGAGPEFAIESGTSMASPHDAGAGALLVGIHPTWTPDQIRSALMTTGVTATVLKDDGTTPADAFDRGSGRLDLTAAGRVGLLFNETGDNYEAADPANGGDPTTLNIASLSQPSCGGTCTWTRTITGTAAATWNAVVDAPAGMTIDVSPSSFALTNGGTQTLTFTAHVSGLPNGDWAFASISLVPNVGSIPAAHLPVAVIPAAGSGNGSSTPTKALHFQGNIDEGCTGNGPDDLLACDGPFLQENPILDENPAAHWSATPLSDGTNARNIYDPNWIWNLDEPTTLRGPMTVQFWATCTNCNALISSVKWEISLWADETNKVLDKVEVTTTTTTAGTPTLHQATVEVPETTASTSWILQIEPVYVDSQNPSTIFYDSSDPCDPSLAAPCDSIVLMPVVLPACSTTPFSDVPTSHPFCPEITWLKTEGITTGFGDGTYRPLSDVTRQAMAAFLARFAEANPPACDTTPPFPDVPVSHPFCKEIQWLKTEGITTGFGDGTFRPQTSVTRQAMAAFLSRVVDANPPACTEAPFPDVPVDHPFCKEINWLKTNHITTGFEDGTFRPLSNVTRQAMAAFLYRTSVVR